MDIKRYTGEDKEFFERARSQNSNLKVFYSPDLFIYHRERRFVGFLLQRFCFGMDFLNLIKFDSGIRGFQPILPISVFISLSIILFANIDPTTKGMIIFSFCFLISLAIILETRKYIKSYFSLLLTIITIGLANIAFAFGSVLALLGLRKLLVNKVYSFSRWNN